MLAFEATVTAVSFFPPFLSPALSLLLVGLTVFGSVRHYRGEFKMNIYRIDHDVERLMLDGALRMVAYLVAFVLCTLICVKLAPVPVKYTLPEQPSGPEWVP
jgi:hypothetical protein